MALVHCSSACVTAMATGHVTATSPPHQGNRPHHRHVTATSGQPATSSPRHRHIRATGHITQLFELKATCVGKTRTFHTTLGHDVSDIVHRSSNTRTPVHVYILNIYIHMIHIYMHVYVCTYVCMHVFLYAHTHALLHALMSVSAVKARIYLRDTRRNRFGGPRCFDQIYGTGEDLDVPAQSNRSEATPHVSNPPPPLSETCV
jgi:hypothetical protein